jgi:hypothetical protein
VVKERKVRRDLAVPRVIVDSSACKVFLDLKVPLERRE